MGDIRTTTSKKTEVSDGNRLWVKFRIYVYTILIIAFGIVALYFVKLPKYAYANGFVTTSEYAEIRASAEGRITKILKTSGDVIEADEILVKLEDNVEKSAYEQSISQISEAEAQLKYREAEATDTIRKHNNAIILAEMELEQARKTLALTKQLFEKSLSSGRQLSLDEFTVCLKEESLRALKEIDTTVITKQLDVLRQNITSLKEASLRARLALEQRSIKSNIDGVLVRYTFYLGEIIRPSMILYEVFNGEVDTMKLRVQERYIAKVRVGQKAEAQLGSLRSFRTKRFQGTVTEIRPVVESNGSSNYQTVYCNLDLNGESVFPGTSVEVRILVGKQSIWERIFEP